MVFCCAREGRLQPCAFSCLLSPIFPCASISARHYCITRHPCKGRERGIDCSRCAVALKFATRTAPLQQQENDKPKTIVTPRRRFQHAIQSVSSTGLGRRCRRRRAPGVDAGGCPRHEDRDQHDRRLGRHSRAFRRRRRAQAGDRPRVRRARSSRRTQLHHSGHPFGAQKSKRQGGVPGHFPADPALRPGKDERPDVARRAESRRQDHDRGRRAQRGRCRPFKRLAGRQLGRYFPDADNQ